MSDINPYEPPREIEQSEILSPLDSQSERIRLEHLEHEAAIKLVGVVLEVVGISNFLGLIGSELGRNGNFYIDLGSVFKVFCLLVLWSWMCLGLIKFWNASRIVVACFALILLFGFFIGTILGGYLLYLLLSQKGAMVFSPRYKKVIGATPHLNPFPSLAMQIFIVTMLLLIGIGIITAWMIY